MDRSGGVCVRSTESTRAWICVEIAVVWPLERPDHGDLDADPGPRGFGGSHADPAASVHQRTELHNESAAKDRRAWQLERTFNCGWRSRGLRALPPSIATIQGGVGRARSPGADVLAGALFNGSP